MKRAGRKGSDGIRAKDGKKLSFTLYTVSGSTATASHAQVVQEALKNIGVEMKLQFEEGALVVARAQKSFDYDMFFFGLTTIPGTGPDSLLGLEPARTGRELLRLQ